jgi:integrase
LRKRGNSWSIVYYDENTGKQVWRSLKTSDEYQAKEIAVKLYGYKLDTKIETYTTEKEYKKSRETLQKKTIEARQLLNIDQIKKALHEYTNYFTKYENTNDISYTVYVNIANRFYNFVNDNGIFDFSLLTKNVFERYLEHVKETHIKKTGRNLKASSIEVHMMNVHKFIAYAVDNRYTTVNNLRSMLKQYSDDRAKEHKKKTELKPLTDKEIEVIRKVIKTQRDKDVFNLLLELGCRKSELTNLLWSNVNMINQTIEFTSNEYNGEKGISKSTLKTNNSKRIIPFGKNVKVIFDRLKKENKTNQPYVINLNRNRNSFSFDIVIMQEIKKIRKDFKLHILRHSLISKLINLNFPIEKVAKHVGDSISMIEKTYYHYQPDMGMTDVF